MSDRLNPSVMFDLIAAHVPSKAVGAGLRALLVDAFVLEEARHAVDVGLLAGYQITTEQLVAIGHQLLADAVEPLAHVFG